MAPYYVLPSRLFQFLCPRRAQRNAEQVRVCDTHLPSVLRLFDVQLQLDIIDTEPTYLEALQQILRSSVSLRIRHFESGEQYASYLQTQRLSKHELHAALISLHFDRSETPKMNGLELLEVVTGHVPKITPIMLAQGDELQFSATALQHGAASIVPRNAMTAMQIASVILFVISQSRITIRRRQLHISLVAFGVSLLLLLGSFFI